MYRHYQSMRRAAMLAACIILGSGSALAVETESIEVGISADGDTDIIVIEDLAIGESRTLTTDSGKPVTVVREAESLLIDLDGHPYEIELPDPQGEGKGFALVSGKEHHIVVMDAQAEGDAATWTDAEPGQRKIVVVRGHAGDEGANSHEVRIIRTDGAAELDIDVDALLQEVEGDDGETRRITVKRRIVRED